MSPDRWQRLEEVFAAVADLPSDEQRRYLDANCDSDPELRQEVEELLQADTGKPLQAVVSAAASNLAKDQDAVDPLIGTFLGPYRIVALLGRGGMGAVYRAIREDDQFSKQVAVKVIPRLLAGPDAIARFRAERQILANLEHPNIARLLDGGTSQGAPYLVMEFVEGGVPITQYVSEHFLSLNDRLALIRSVCAAVQYAHSNLIVHRDLKPANILIAADGSVKLLDFGIAKILEPTPSDSQPTAGQMITPDFASPEQIRGETVTTSTDVYSLGIVVYEVLTGERPYRASGQSPGEMERIICHTEPRRPSDVDGTPPKLRRKLAGDLDNIVLMAIRKDPARRYRSAEHLSEDIRRHLDGMPVRARPDTIAYRAGKFMRRNVWPIAAGFLIASSLIAGTVVSVRQARAARNRFDQLRGFARTMLVDLHGQLADIPGTSRARQALTEHVSDYLKKIVANNAEDDEELATEIAATYLRLSELQGTTPDALGSLDMGRKLLERKRARGSAAPADLLMLARLRLRMGNTFSDLSRPVEATEHLLAATSLAVDVGKEGGLEPIKIRARADWRLARIHRVQYRLDDAERHARAALAACVSAHAPDDREIDEIRAGTQFVLGGVLRRQGKWDESLRVYLEALADDKRRLALNPGSAQLQRDLARAHSIVADLLSQIPGQEAATRTHVREAIARGEKLAALDPHDKTAQSELAQYLSLGGEALTQPKDREEVERYLRRALPIFQTLLHGEPDSGTFLLYAALTEAELGDCIGKKQLTRESILPIRNGLKTIEHLVARDRANTTNVIELIKLQKLLANNLARAGEAGEAIALSQAVIATARRISGTEGSQTEVPKRELIRAYIAMGDIFARLGRRAESIRNYRVAVTEFDVLRAKGFILRDSEAEIGLARTAAAQAR